MQCKCDNCGHLCDAGLVVRTLADFTGQEMSKRLDPGGMVPVGECPVCRSLTYPVYSFWHQMLMRLTEKVERVNAIQHSGGSIEAEDWSELHALTNEAKAVLQRTDPLVQAGCRRSHRQKILIQQICDLARENDSERRIDQRDAIIEKLNA